MGVPVAAEVAAAAAAAGVAVALAEEDVASEVSVPAAASSVEASGVAAAGMPAFPPQPKERQKIQVLAGSYFVCSSVHCARMSNDRTVSDFTGDDPVGCWESV
eukprot:CAMPEP_0197717270 /NCGR_PEP_ID=MMETSP1434-20131217/1862_1 /TAXON_ID=265543 /ORGANISM="Minutocellus polymorphus, Strain CCMP3303" /LENGTH=102 /DNA_ID=CAMNT_0043301773 /DNA_START=206 /DNA_END=513 /DNA_ORIENTATION=+